jgi:hypothetical protein
MRLLNAVKQITFGAVINVGLLVQPVSDEV